MVTSPSSSPSATLHPVLPRPIKACIFDFDGTLVDSEANYLKADQALLGEYGINFTKAMKAEFVGRGNAEMVATMAARYHLPDDGPTLLEKKNKLYLKFALENTTVFPPMRQLLELLQKISLPLAVASGTSRSILAALLKKTNLAPFFSVVLSSEEVAAPKPAPDVFLAAAQKLNLSPETCLVIEDSPYGVQAAKKAGMRVIAIPDPEVLGPPSPVFQEADLLFAQGMKSVDAQAVGNWIKQFS
ncbi:MAG: HAD family phosphatase [Bacteriovoracaceae bacterium]|nr:HAD family phosphatase [Bacteriovoracaceae bacterium]